MRTALIADLDPNYPPHRATEEAVRHTSQWVDQAVEADWISTTELQEATQERLQSFDALWIAPGSPYRSLTGALAAIRFARENHIPLLGTCGGFQHVVIEYARHVLGVTDAAHAEYDPYASRLFISQLDCSLAGKTMQVRLAHGTKAAAAYGRLSAREAYYCNFAINPQVTRELFSHRLVISGTDDHDQPRVIELPDHRFFVATLFVPQMQSQPRQPHPLIESWLAAAAGG